MNEKSLFAKFFVVFFFTFILFELLSYKTCLNWEASQNELQSPMIVLFKGYPISLNFTFMFYFTIGLSKRPEGGFGDKIWSICFL